MKMSLSKKVLTIKVFKSLFQFLFCKIEFLCSPIKFPFFLLLPYAFQGHYYLEVFGVLSWIKLQAISVEILPCSPISVQCKVVNTRNNQSFIISNNFLALGPNFWCLILIKIPTFGGMECECGRAI